MKDAGLNRISGALVQYDSTVRPETTITVESGLLKDSTLRFGYFVRVRTAGVITHEESRGTEKQARGRFERVVELHVAGEALNQ